MSVVAVAAALTWLPSTAEAQSGINGSRQGFVGAVMPGVTVEAASDALIEG